MAEKPLGPRLFAALLLLSALASCRRAEQTVSAAPRARGGADASALKIAPDVPERLRRLPRTAIDYDRGLLDEKETRVVGLLIEASRLIDEIFLRQVSEENPRLREELRAAAGGDPAAAGALALFEIHKGPWDRLARNAPFVGDRPKPAGAAFYPPDATKDEIETWIASHPADKQSFQSQFTVIRREGDRLAAIPYSRQYRELLARTAAKLREAAAATGNASLRAYLTSRADAFLSDDYFASDVAWMDLDSEIEVVIGPYEVYEDGLFNYKAAFESFVTVRDRAESDKLGVYARHLKEMEGNLPIPDRHKNLNRGFESPIRVVQEIFTAGDARRGVQTSAFNLPNDERVREAKGSKKVLLKNVMEAKFRRSGRPVAERLLDPSQSGKISFDAYFNHTLFHELAHGLGPGIIRGPDGRRVEARLLLKNLYSAIEECKADVLGVWNILFAMGKKLPMDFDEEALFVTDAGLMFRSMRFGLDEAHGSGTAVQWNWYREKGAILPADGGRFRVDAGAFRAAVRSLAEELLMIEATGDFDRARKLLDRYGKSNAEIESVTRRLEDIPVDIAPVFVAAGETMTDAASPEEPAALPTHRR
ncbi:MAG: peptidase [Thermoanaerobaculia bacterium]